MRRRWNRSRTLVAALSCVAIGCEGIVADSMSPRGATPRGEGTTPPAPAAPPPTVPQGADPLAHPVGLGPIAARRLTQTELVQVLDDVLAVDATPHLRFLPEDQRTPFDNFLGLLLELVSSESFRFRVEG